MPPNCWASNNELKRTKDLDTLEEVRKQFSEMAALPDDRIDLVKAALLIARSEYPQLHESVYTERLDALAATLKQRIAPLSGALEQIKALNTLLFDEEGFRGNTENYHDPRNSYLNQVIYRKLGIPISLSLVYMAVGRGAGLDLRGVGLPGHFICVLIHQTEKVFIDPFNGGKILSEKACRKMAIGFQGESAAFDRHLLDPVGPRQLLNRILRNLKSLYLNMNRELKAFQMIEWILTLEPDAVVELRDRGLLYESMGNFKLAARDLMRYLELAPQAPDMEKMAEKISLYKEKTPLLH
jgi:regulator of sirC expression with transglutaminase-like and TPR domain